MTDLFGNIPIQGDTPREKKRPTAPARTRRTTTSDTNTKQDSQRPGDDRKNSRGKRKLKYLLFPLAALVLFACYCGLTSVLVPYYITSRLPQKLETETGILLAIKEAAFNPVTARLELMDITIDTADRITGKTQLAHVKKVVGDMDVIAYLRHDIVTKQLVVEGAEIQLTRYQDGSYTVSDFFTHYKKKEIGEMDFLEIPFLYSLNNITITESSLLLKDLVADKRHSIDNIEMQIPSLSNFSYVLDHYIQPGFSATINGSPVKLVSEVRQAGDGDGPASTRFSYALESVDLPLYSGYVPFTFPVMVTKGKASGNIDLTFTGDEDTGRQLTLHFSLNVEDSVFSSDTANLTIPHLSVEGDAQPLRKMVSISNLLVQEPTLYVKTLNTDNHETDTSGKQEPTGREQLPGLGYSPSLVVDQLVCDNGTVEISGTKGKTHLHSVQLSIKNYSNRERKQQKSETAVTNIGTFRFQSSQKSGFVTWKGEIHNGRLTGPLEIENLKLQQMADLLWQNGTETAGTANIKGNLTVFTNRQKPHFSFDKAHIILDNVSFSEKKQTWFSSNVMRIAEAHFSDKKLDVGNIFIEDGYLTLTDTGLPSFFTSLRDRKDFSFKGIDYKGRLSFQSAEFPPVLLKPVSFQVKSQPDEGGENLAFSAHTETQGSVQAKGKINILPLQGTLQIHANKVAYNRAMRSLFRPLSRLTPATLVSATGELVLPAESFTGSFVLEDGAIQHGSTHHGFKEAAFENCLLHPGKKQLSAKRISITNYSNTYDETHLSFPTLLLNNSLLSESSLHVDAIVGQEGSVTTTRPLLEAIKATSQQFSRLSLSAADISGTFAITPAKAADTVSVPHQRGIFTLSAEAITEKIPKTPNLHFTVDIEKAGRIEGEANVTSSRKQGDGVFILQDIPAQALANLTGKMSFTNLQGKISGKVKRSFQSPHYSGSVSIADGSLQEPAGKPLLTWDQAALTDFSYTPGSAGSSIGSLEMDAPVMEIALDKASLPEAIFSKLERAFPKSENETSAISFSALNIENIQIADGEITTTRPSITPKDNQLLSALNGTISQFHISKTHDPISYILAGKVNNAPFTVSGELDPGKEKGNRLVSFSLSKLPLSSCADEFAAIFPKNSIFSSSLLNITLKERSFEQQHLAFTLTLPEMPLPQKDLPPFTKYLITPENTIHDSILLQENGQGILSQLSAHFQRQKIKSSLSPALLLPASFQEIPLEHVVFFAEGDATLPAKDLQEFEKLCQILYQRPYLSLKLSSVVNPAGDRRVIKQKLEEQEAERVRLENIRLKKEWQKKMANQPVPEQPSPDGEITERDIPPAQLETFTPIKAKPQRVTDEMLIRLGYSRLKILHDFIVEKYAIDPARLHINDDIQLIDDLDSPGVTLKISDEP